MQKRIIITFVKYFEVTMGRTAHGHKALLDYTEAGGVLLNTGFLPLHGLGEFCSF